MDQNNNGGPAFARPASSIDREAFKAQNGLSTRDYFAAKAMQGFVAAGHADDMSPEAIAASSYLIANAMLARREA
jgi:hypothetical protein